MLVIHESVTLSYEKDGEEFERVGTVRLSADRLEFVSGDFLLAVDPESIEFIEYEDEILLALFNDPTDYHIFAYESAKLQEDINGLLSRWMKTKTSIDLLGSFYERGVPTSVLGEWLMHIGCFEHISMLVQPGEETGAADLEKARTILSTLAKIEEAPVINEMIENISVISSAFGMPYNEASEIEKYVCDPEIERSNRLHWLKKNFYELQMGIVKVALLEKLIEESHHMIVWKILPQISEKISKPNIRNIFEEVQDRSTLKIFIQQLQKMGVLSGLDFAQRDDIFILYYVALADWDVFCALIVGDPTVIESIFVHFNIKMHEGDLEAAVHIQSIIEAILESPRADMGLRLLEYLPALFELPGSKHVRMTNGWPHISSSHNLGVYHLQILNFAVKRLPTHVKIYVIRSGIVVAMLEDLAKMSETQKYLVCNIVYTLVRKRDIAVQKYISTSKLQAVLVNAMQEAMPQKSTAYSPIMRRLALGTNDA
ncbi:uncharacterized protein NEMAJ01_1403 [Nematocida major]|uniref:uncharacterized protein n=1 Tax=Nematocida major TaxID=1912982 RepID=UPI002007B1C8|nr:uncharacterized protein NEMAJ01_1403 [Nematocida major]KAH9386507.1 hypothetical protein NEMAJ01_1403 [Nematocida major]